MQFEPTNDQINALNSILTWYHNPSKPYLTLGGYAGTGKTSLLAGLRQVLFKLNPKLTVAFCAFTGKASLVLEQTLTTHQSRKPRDRISTIHSLIYAPIMDDRGSILGWKTKSELKTDLIIVDEASMLDKQLWQDLLSFGVPILAVGDHGQLPPIRPGFNLMEKPDIRLEVIHRQAADNPIIHLSMLARKNGQIPFGKFGQGVRKLNRFDSQTGDEVEQILSANYLESLILTGFNTSRMELNKQIRIFRGYETENPQPGDRVICLRNNLKKGLYNGMIGEIIKIQSADKNASCKPCFEAEINLENDNLKYAGNILKKQFNNPISCSQELKGKDDYDLFDFGYALTVHKAQGSQAKKVVLFEERNRHMTDDDWRRWLYTGITRAEVELTIIGN